MYNLGQKFGSKKRREKGESKIKSQIFRFIFWWWPESEGTLIVYLGKIKAIEFLILLTDPKTDINHNMQYNHT